mgnify:CR=1 FL=1
MSHEEAATISMLFRAYSKKEIILIEGMDEVARSELEPAKQQIQFLLAMQHPAFRQAYRAMITRASHHCLHGDASSELGGYDVVMLRYNDPQPASTASSYIISAGAFIIALLAVQSALKNAESDPPGTSRALIRSRTRKATNFFNTDLIRTPYSHHNFTSAAVHAMANTNPPAGNVSIAGGNVPH